MKAYACIYLIFPQDSRIRKLYDRCCATVDEMQTNTHTHMIICRYIHTYIQGQGRTVYNFIKQEMTDELSPMHGFIIVFSRRMK